jgi:anti-sigma B factor antagonist
MTIKSEIIDDILILNIEIKRAIVDIADTLKDKLIKKINEGKSKVIIDMSQIEFADSSFLSALLAGLKQASLHDGDIKLVGLQPSVQYVFQITRLEKVFDIHKHLDSALKSFSKI